jgi:hypothetical protein
VGDGFNMINSEAVVQFANRNEVDRVTIHQSTGIDHKTIDDHAVIRSHCQVAVGQGEYLDGRPRPLDPLSLPCCAKRPQMRPAPAKQTS